jgi:glutaminyl-tRNA synthetase
VVKDAEGNVVELRCSYDPESRGGTAPDGRKVRGTIHWVSAAHALRAEVRLYGPLFAAPDPGPDDAIDPASLEILQGCRLEPGLAELPVGEVVQFERTGYFCPDPDSTPEAAVFNRTVALRDSWAKIAAKGR